MPEAEHVVVDIVTINGGEFGRVRSTGRNSAGRIIDGFREVRMLAYVLTVMFAFAPAALAAVTVPQQGQVEGEVIQVFPTAIVIRNDQGQGTVLQITSRTQLGAQFKPGDKIVAYVTPYGVSSIQLKTNTALMP